MSSTNSQPELLKEGEEFRMFMERFMHFLNLWTIYTDYLKKKYVPSVEHQSAPGDSPTDMWATLMFILYAFFYSLIEDSDEGLNGFRVWRMRYPEEESAIAVVEAQVLPFRQRLKWFRNRMGFHGSCSRSHEARGVELFSAHSGSQILEAMKSFKSLGAALAAKSNARNGMPGYDEARVRSWIDSITERARIATERK
jgi:hypothetical protein